MLNQGGVSVKYVYISENSSSHTLKYFLIMLLFLTKDIPVFLSLEQYLQYWVFFRVYVYFYLGSRPDLLMWSLGPLCLMDEIWLFSCSYYGEN